MTITVHIPQTIEVARIRHVYAIAGGRAHVVFVDAMGRYVAGTVACHAEAVRALMDADAARMEEDARMAAESWS